ncbi:MAG: hypothetical protein CVT62_04170 [Actinobacteria bacterium HGW-Actinobacteria-2]|nr:MAG: hypothetical protein CVT62_04170 [Actinobacteria bacterium HGW-Actinobacteria-2]
MTSTWARTVEIAPERLSGWLARFAERHGTPTVVVSDDAVVLTCPDQAQARIALRWGPLAIGDDPLAALVDAYQRARTVAALIVRRRGHAVGLFQGATLVTGRHDHHYVQGRTKAGGWSQQRYARRRDNQARHAYAEAISDAADVLLPTAPWDALAVGGDQVGIDQVLNDARLAPLRDLPRIVVAGVPDPNAGVLNAFGERFRAAPISLNELA